MLRRSKFTTVIKYLSYAVLSLLLCSALSLMLSKAIWNLEIDRPQNTQLSTQPAVFTAIRQSMGRALSGLQTIFRLNGEPNMPTQQTIAGHSLGTNLSGITDYSTELPFLDAFRSARNWSAQSLTEWGTGTPLSLDANGWVKSLPAGQFAGTLLLDGIANVAPGGRYIVTYKGSGTIEYGFDGSKIAADSKPGRDVIQYNSAGMAGIWMKITSTDPKHSGDYIRDIHVYREADLPLVQQGELFNPAFVQKIKPFGGLRFMDWMQANGSLQHNWSDRPTLQTASWATNGVPVEALVALANETHENPWFNLPIGATDDYIRNFATYVRDHLDPTLKASVELSNEVWNWGFTQAHYAQEQAAARWGDKGNWMEWYGMRTAQMADIWKSVYGSQSHSRLSTVISSQTAYHGLENYALDSPVWVAEGNQAPSKHVDAYAITGYFSGSLGNPDHQSIVHSWLNEPDGGFGKAFQQLEHGRLLPGDYQDSVDDTIKEFGYHKNVADQRGLSLVVYEGGQSISGSGSSQNDQQLTDFFIALNHRPEMYNLYQKLLEGWKQAGGTLFNNFSDIGTATKWGSWGALDQVNQAHSPKYDALIDFMATHPKWWDDGTASTVDGSGSSGSANGLRLIGSSGSDILTGSNFNDVIAGGTGNDRLSGKPGNDSLSGGRGIDILVGDSGNDLLVGNSGSDVLRGGAGSDRFIYSINTTFTSPSLGIDTVLDFTVGTDKIVLGKSTFKSLTSKIGQGISTAGEFAKTTSDVDAAVSGAPIVYNSANGKLFYNQNGNAAGFGQGAQLVSLTNRPNLTAADFMIQ